MDVVYARVNTALREHEYPPTHTYTVGPHGLAPGEQLSSRLKAIESVCPDFFTARHFLDVGASKGYFTLRAAQSSEHVTAIESDTEVWHSWFPLQPENATVLIGTFEEVYNELDSYDMVWLGNCHHYLHRANPEGWVPAVTLLASDHIVVEGPVGRLCADCAPEKGWKAREVPEEQDWLTAMASHGFHCVASTPSPSPGRRVWHLRWIKG